MLHLYVGKNTCKHRPKQMKYLTGVFVSCFNHSANKELFCLSDCVAVELSCIQTGCVFNAFAVLPEACGLSLLSDPWSGSMPWNLMGEPD